MSSPQICTEEWLTAAVICSLGRWSLIVFSPSSSFFCLPPSFLYGRAPSRLTSSRHNHDDCTPLPAIAHLHAVDALLCRPRRARRCLPPLHTSLHDSQATLMDTHHYQQCRHVDCISPTRMGIPCIRLRSHERAGVEYVDILCFAVLPGIPHRVCIRSHTRLPPLTSTHQRYIPGSAVLP